MSDGTKLVLGIIAAIVLIGGLVAGGYAIKYATADARGAVDQQELVRADGQYRLAAYNHFFDLCSSIQADEDRIKNLQEELESGNLTPARANTLPSTITATKNGRADKVRRYNQDAQKAGSVGIFRSNKLPYYININEMETVCA